MVAFIPLRKDLIMLWSFGGHPIFRKMLKSPFQLTRLFFRRCQAKLECSLQGASQGRMVWRTSSCSCSRTLHATDWSNGAAGPIQFGTSAIAGVARARLHATTNCLWDFSSRFFLEVYSWRVLSKETWPQGSGVFLLCMRQVASGYMVAVYYEVQMTRIQPTARISNVEESCFK